MGRREGMVLKDFYTTDIKHHQNDESRHFLASPGDRIVASFFDLLFHLPFFSLSCFIILYRLNLLKLTIASTSELMAVMGQLVWVGFIGSIVLNSIYLKFWKKTPGMRIMKLEVKSLAVGMGSAKMSPGNKPEFTAELTWEQCLLRSAAWAAELMMLGLPLLVILSHSRRRSFHDRLAETEVVSLKPFDAPGPLPSERAMVSLVTMAMIMLGLGWVTAFFSLTQKGIQNGTMALSEWREQGQLCSQVDEISTYSSIDLTNLNRRLDFSIALFLLEQIDSTCLNKEIDFAFFKRNAGALTWLGRALISTPHTEERTEYLKKACEIDAHWCQRSLIHEKVSVDEVRSLLSSTSSGNEMGTQVASKRGANEESLAYMVAKLILFNRVGADAQAETLVKTLQTKGIRATGLVAEHLKVISRGKPEELTTALTTLQSVMVEKDYLKLNSEMCLSQLEAGCSSKVNECNMMRNLLPNYKNESMDDLTISRALFKESICKQNLDENMEYWTLVSNKSLQKLVQLGFDVTQPSTQGQALAHLRSFVKDESQIVELRFDALQILMSYSSYTDDWKLAFEFWKQLNWTEKNYLTASEWILREAKKSKQESLVQSMTDVASKIPGLRLEWELVNKIGKGYRLPASEKKNK